jgi:uncharacterized membrane protein required for colicin V production
LGWLDRLLGLAFGGLKAIVVGIVLVLVLTAFPFKPVPDSVAHSTVAPYLIDAAHALTYAMPAELRAGFAETSDKVREFWRDNVRKRAPRALESEKD